MQTIVNAILGIVIVLVVVILAYKVWKHEVARIDKETKEPHTTD
jgi:hypothetical protein